LATDFWVVGTVGGVVALLAYDQGGFGLASRAATAMVLWWAVLLGLGLRVWPRVPVGRSAQLVLALFAAFASWTFASIFWAESAERAFMEFNRTTMYLAIIVVAVVAGMRSGLHRWADGLAAGIVAIAVVSAISRFFPSAFGSQGVPTFLPNAATRLSFPLGYWNGLGIFVGLAFPLCLGLGVRASNWWARAFAMAPFPILSAVLYLTSSRGGVVTAGAGTIAFVAATARRWTAFGAVLAAGAGSAAAIVILLPRNELVNGPVRSSTAAAQGHGAFMLILAACITTGALFAIGHATLSHLRSPGPAVERGLLAVLIVGIALIVVASHPVERFHDFKQFTNVAGTEQGGFVRAHLLSGSGSGRWQFWTAAAEEWKSAPVAGRGAGSYEAWWAQHAPFSYFVRNAHSLYLEVLGELGTVGFLLLTGALALGGVIAVRNTARLQGDDRVVAASLFGALVAFFVGAGLDWVWQLTAVSTVGLVCLGLLIGTAGASPMPHAVSQGERRRSTRVPRFALGGAVLLSGWLLLCAQALPWLTDLQIKASAAAVARNDGASAFRHALDAKELEPWGSSPYLQLALVQEQREDLKDARKWIAEAIERNPIDWRLWLVRARIETKANNIPAGRRSLLRAQALNPRSPLFAAETTAPSP
jgi:hypothetical protein